MLSGNEATRVTAETICYLTDTLPGSSGSPVFDKRWDVVALHRAALRGPDGEGFVENEGVRAEVIRSHLTAVGSR